MSNDVNGQPSVPEADDVENKSPRRILIGSQKDPAAYRPNRSRDWKPAVPEEGGAASESPQAPVAPPSAEPQVAAPAVAPPVQAEAAVAAVPPAAVAAAPVSPVEPPVAPAAPAPVAAAPAFDTAALAAEPAVHPAAQMLLDEADEDDALSAAAAAGLADSGPASASGFPPTNFRGRLSPDLEQEVEAALEGLSLDDLLTDSDAVSKQVSFEPDTKQAGRVLAVRGDDVFVELGGREQGVVSLRQMPAPPAVGDKLEVRVVRFNAAEGLYDLAVAHTAAAVSDWGDVTDGMLVEAKVTGHNAGGLECEVNRIRGFIPISQIALYRVEDLTEFVDQKFTCLVTEANRDRRNLVLSRRAVLEREKEEARQTLMATLQPGQVFTGVVRKIMDFGAFVDIGGVDGLLHVSQLSWARVKHPSDVLKEGQSIQVRVNKVDAETGKISFGYRDMLENPWTQAAAKFPASTIVHGVVTKLMEFGAFVQLEPGVEGLVHISELSPKRIWRPSDVVKEGQEVEVLVLSVDAENQRISLSMKAVAILNEPKKVDPKDELVDAAPPPPAIRKQSNEPLKGGVQRSAGGEQFGLKW